MRSGRGLHLARAGSFPARSLRCKNPIVLTSRELHRVRMIAGEWHEIPGPLVIDAQVGGIDYFRGEHIIGALLCQGFDVVADRKHEFHGHFWARRTREGFGSSTLIAMGITAPGDLMVHGSTTDDSAVIYTPL
jgi:hypothetical protein